MADLESDMPYEAFTKKWAKKPGIKLLLSKDIWGNKQKAIFLKSEEKDDQMTSIITVAGISSRFNKGISENEKVLKCIYTDDSLEDTLLYHMAGKLSSSERIIIVGGYRYDDLEKYINGFMNGRFESEFTLVRNDHYADLSSGYSLYLGIEKALNYEPDEIVFVEGDLDIDGESVDRVLNAASNVCTYNHEPIYSDKAVVLYTDADDRIKYAFNSSHGMLQINDPFGCILNSGQMWKFKDMHALRRVNDEFCLRYRDSTNLRIIQSYLDSVDRNSVSLVGLDQWTNCNTREDYFNIRKRWSGRKV